ncbi:methionine ABC transporter permease [Succinivibrio dextrinosolvens]|jgi:D-methionine transport system permease protein|uniref:D-methionine transport system permease protein n=1 Tax=Succinivibrio dextrinosolvens DSM 3072 TaxID=1123324 RepID=A0A1T4VWN1_9GAMM|nr:methionine ABC transporter permease [Succinivibrio dextrinosolvens]SKA68891.1 D-methionine transport system permease protein [Succinivibrio dextrinosolvens DSM 3072]
MNQLLVKTFSITSDQLILCANQTLYMVFVSLFLGSIIGFILAFILVLTKKNGLKENRVVFTITSTVINCLRSIPFVILLVFILPVTKAIVGTRIGTTAALVPLITFISPYLARLFENSLLEVKSGIIDAAKAMGANTLQIIFYFWLPEAKGSLILSITIGAISLLGATAMAGVIGAGGIGDLALTYGYERMNSPLMLFTVIVLIIFVQAIQSIGNYFAKKSKRI